MNRITIYMFCIFLGFNIYYISAEEKKAQVSDKVDSSNSGYSYGDYAFTKSKIKMRSGPGKTFGEVQ